MSSASRILDVAEEKMRVSGYHAVSYRDIAAEIGLRSASLHYHFPKKADLGRALVERYSARFFEQLSIRSEGLDDQDAIAAFVKLYRDALGASSRVCLCVMLGAEGPGLPEAVKRHVQMFIDRNLAWLEDRLQDIGDVDAKRNARRA